MHDLRRSGAQHTAYLLALAYVVLAGGLIVLRAFDQDFAFLGVGWILVFALVPLLPWLLPLVGPWFPRMAPYFQNVRIGVLAATKSRGQGRGLPEDFQAVETGLVIRTSVKS